MHVASTGWAALYYASTAAAVATLVAIPMVILVENLDPVDRSDAYPWLGAATGAMLGLGLARWKRNSTTTHRVLRIVGGLLGLLGLVGGVVMNLMAEQQQRDNRSGVLLLAGFAEFLMALLAFAVAGIGITLWLAGVSGRRNAQPIASSEGVPIQ